MDLALALIISRVVKPGSKLSTLTWWSDTTLGDDLGVAGATTDDVYAAMDQLEHRQDAIEAELARRHLAPEANPARMALSGLSARGWKARGARWPPAATPGTARKGAADRVRAVTDPAGRPVAVRVFPATPATPPRSPPSRTWCGRSSGWPRWSWSATGG